MRLQWHFEYCYARFGFVDLVQGRALLKGVGGGGERGEEGCMEIEMGNGHFEVQFILSKLFSAALCQ